MKFEENCSCGLNLQSRSTVEAQQSDTIKHITISFAALQQAKEEERMQQIEPGECKQTALSFKVL